MNAISQAQPRLVIDPPKNPPRRPECCLQKVIKAVCRFFTAIAEAIWGAITWTCAKLAEICCCCCQDDEDDNFQVQDPVNNRINQVRDDHIEPPKDDEIDAPVDLPEDTYKPPVEPVKKDIYANIPDAERAEWEAIMNLKDEAAAPDDIEGNGIKENQGADENAAPMAEVEFHEQQAIRVWDKLNENEIEFHKMEGLARLNEIKEKNVQFRVHEDRILKFDLDIALEPYNTKNYSHDKFLELLDYACPGFKDKTAFDDVLNRRNQWSQGRFKDYHPELVKTTQERIQKLYVILNEKKEQLALAPDQKKEKDFKELIRSTVIRILQAHTAACIVGTNSRMGTICADVLSNVAAGGFDPKTQLQYMAANAVYKQKLDLIAKITAANYGSVYDELALRKEIAGSTPKGPNSAKVQAYYDQSTKAPTDGSQDERPLPFLLRGLVTPPEARFEDIGTLEADLRNYANYYFGLLNNDKDKFLAGTYDDDFNPITINAEARDIVRLASQPSIDTETKQPNGDAFTSEANTQFSEAGALWILEAAGIIEEIEGKK